jgi:hypothetical protein
MTRVTFAWKWTGPALGSNQGFEVRIWKENQLDHYGAAAPVRDTSIEIDVSKAYGVQQGGDGGYFWTVALVQLEPYQRIGSEAPLRRMQVSFGKSPPPP